MRAPSLVCGRREQICSRRPDTKLRGVWPSFAPNSDSKKLSLTSVVSCARLAGYYLDRLSQSTVPYILPGRSLKLLHPTSNQGRTDSNQMYDTTESVLVLVCGMAHHNSISRAKLCWKIGSSTQYQGQSCLLLPFCWKKRVKLCLGEDITFSREFW